MNEWQEGGKAGGRAPPSSLALVSPHPAVLPRPLSVLGHLPQHICLLKALKSPPRGNQFVFAPPSVWDLSLFFFFIILVWERRRGAPELGANALFPSLPTPPCLHGLLSAGPAEAVLPRPPPAPARCLPAR